MDIELILEHFRHKTVVITLISLFLDPLRPIVVSFRYFRLLLNQYIFLQDNNSLLFDSWTSWIG